MKEIETEHLVLKPGNNERDNAPFLKMLREEGDFRGFSGIDFSERNLMNFHNYLGSQCRYSIFRKNEMIGYVGIGCQSQRYETEFYISKPYRNAGYCTEALMKFLKEVFVGNLMRRDDNGTEERLLVQEIYATILSVNSSAIRVLEKCGFVKNPEVVMLFSLFIDSETEDTYKNDVTDYILRSLPDNPYS